MSRDNLQVSVCTSDTITCIGVVLVVHLPNMSLEDGKRYLETTLEYLRKGILDSTITDVEQSQWRVDKRE